jgi:CTP:molybdopterin cytidylyltransferase MocA
MIAALILAAGKSERMGYPKALLKIGNETFVARLLRIARAAGIEQSGVVLGHRAEEVRQQLDLSQTSVFINHQYECGQLSSLQCGMRNLPLELCTALLVLPVDRPLISIALVVRMITYFANASPVAVIPICSGRRGHPVLFSKSLFQDLLDCPLDLDARTVLRRHSSAIAYLECDEEGILLNVDTPEDYRHLLQLETDKAQ